MHIRRSIPEDTPALASVYRDAVLGLGCMAYTDDQVAVWASFADNPAEFDRLVRQGYTLVAIVDGQIVSFCQLHPSNHVALLYTATSHSRKGLATAVYRGVERHAREAGQKVLTTDASKLSRPFFAGQGFVVQRTEHTMRQGVPFERYQMTKSLDAG